MAVKTLNELKAFFETGDKPTQQQFWDWLDSFIHKGDGIEIDDVDGLTEALQGKADVGDSSPGNRVYDEVPTGIVNGTNQDFVLAHAPLAGKYAFYLNGVKQNKVTYSITGTALHVNTAPLTDDELSIDYDY